MSRLPDAKTRYRVEFDMAVERGEVTPEAVAKNECAAWNNYLRAAIAVTTVTMGGLWNWLPASYGPPGALLINHCDHQTLGRIIGIDHAARTMTITADPSEDRFFGIDRSATTRFTQTYSWAPPPRFRAKPSRVPERLIQRRMDGRRE